MLPAEMSDQQILDLIERDRLQTTAVVAHEILERIKSPMALIRGRAENLKSQLEFYQKDNAQGILDQLDQLEQLVRSMEQFVSAKPAARNSIGVHDLVHELSAFFQYRLSRSHILILNMVPRDCVMKINESDLKTMLTSTLVNAMEALEESSVEGRCIFVQCQETISEHILTIEDNGPGVQKSVLKSLFLPFLTTKKGHIGLSLSICRRIAEKAGWTFELVSRENQGARVEIRIPHASLKA